MGSSQSSHPSAKFIQTMQDEIFGTIDIYKNQQAKYIMKLQRTLMRDKDGKYVNDYGFKQILNFVTENGNTQQFFTPVLQVNEKMENLCITYQVVDTFCEYFNFTLADMVKHKKQMDKQEIWLCFVWCLQMMQFLSQKKWDLKQGLSLKRILITLSGTLNISVHHVIKSSSNDNVFTETTKPVLQQIGLCILQLVCMTTINQGQNLELYLRKAQKIDSYLGQILGSLLRKTIKNKNKQTINEVLDKIFGLCSQNKIMIADQIKLNKFKYIIPKPQQQNVEPEKQKQKPVVINFLHGRKQKNNQSEHSSSKRSTVQDSHDPPLQSSVSKMLSAKGNNLNQEIQNKKREIQKQKAKLTQRKEFILKNKVIEKQNFLGNSVREIRPSFARKNSWSKKVVNQQFKESQKRIA